MLILSLQARHSSYLIRSRILLARLAQSPNILSLTVYFFMHAARPELFARSSLLFPFKKHMFNFIQFQKLCGNTKYGSRFR